VLLVVQPMTTAAAPGADAGAVRGPDASAAWVAQSTDNETGLGPADHVYVERDGDVILVLNGTDAAPNGTADDDALDPGVREAGFGLLTGEGLVYGLYAANRSTIRDDGESPFDGTLSAATTLEPDRVAAGGTLTGPRPRQLRDLQVSLTGARTTGRAAATLSGTAAVALDDATAAGRLVERAEADTYARLGPQNLTLRTNATASLAPSAATLAEPLRYEAVLTEEPGVYRLAVERNTTVAPGNVGNWSTRERARATLERRFLGEEVASLANASLDLRSHAFREATDGEGGRVVVSYAVRYEGVKARLKPVLTAALAADERGDVSTLQAERIAGDLLSVTVERAAVRGVSRDGRIEGETELRLRDYDRAVTATLDLAQAYNVTENETVGRQVRGFRERFEAVREAGLVREYRLGATYTRPATGRAAVDVTGAYRTTNWDAYVAELDGRGIVPPNLTFDLHARTDGDRVRGNASAAVGRAGLLDDAIDGVRNLSRAGVDQDIGDPTTAAEREEFEDAQQVLDAVERSDLRRARFAINITRDEARLEGAGRFGNVSAFRPLLRNDTTGELPTDLRVREVVARSTGGEDAPLYVHAESAVPVRPSAAAVRDLAAVEDGTTVHMPGTWDRAFPEVDRERAYGFLEVTPPDPTPTETPLPTTGATDDATGGAGPGFGTTPAALALLVCGALLALRHRDD
jgi:hypothetical protein